MTTRSMMAQHNATHCLWSSETLHKPIKDSLMVWKPDLVLREVPSQNVFGPKPVFSWKGIISFMELMSGSYSLSDGICTICNSVMHKVYAIFASQPGWRFLFALLISNQEFHLHMFDHSGVVHSQPYNIHKSPHVLLHMQPYSCSVTLNTLGSIPLLFVSCPSTNNFHQVLAPFTSSP